MGNPELAIVVALLADNTYVQEIACESFDFVAIFVLTNMLAACRLQSILCCQHLTAYAFSLFLISGSFSYADITAGPELAGLAAWLATNPALTKIV